MWRVGGINGLNGNLVLHSIEARTGATIIHAQGDIIGSPKATNLDISVTKGRAQDLLRPFLREAFGRDIEASIHLQALKEFHTMAGGFQAGVATKRHDSCDGNPRRHSGSLFKSPEQPRT